MQLKTVENVYAPAGLVTAAGCHGDDTEGRRELVESEVLQPTRHAARWVVVVDLQNDDARHD